MRRVQPETQIQRAVVDHLRARGVDGLVFWHTPNGAFYGAGKNFNDKAARGAIMKRLGVRAGVSDIIAFHSGKLFCLELKAKGGRATEFQLQFLSDMDKQGAFTCCAEGLDQAVNILTAWGLLRFDRNDNWQSLGDVAKKLVERLGEKEGEAA